MPEVSGGQPTDSIDKLVERLRVVVNQRREARLAEVRRGQKLATALIVVVFTALIVVGVVGGRRLVAPIEQAMQALREGAAQTTSAAGEVASSAQTLSQGATEQAASLEETSASMEELSASTRHNAERATRAGELMRGAESHSGDARAALDRMVKSMEAITTSSREVARIIETIDEIAFQTNILALNAAVEAARDTAGLIEAAVSRAQEGAETVGQVTGAFQSISASLTEVRGLVEEVGEGSRQQSNAVAQVAQAVASMERVTQTTAATAEESAAASEELSAQAEATMAVVGQLRDLVSGAGRTPKSPPADELQSQELEQAA